MTIKLAAVSDIRALKQFAFSMAWAIPLIFGVVLPWIFNLRLHWWPFAISGMLILLYLFFPKAIYPLYRSWMFIALILGWINTRVILALIFYIIILPMGILLRVFDKLQYREKPKRNDRSFWVMRDKGPVKNDLERPF